MNIDEYVSNITRDSFGWWKVVFRSPHLHKVLESTIFHDLEWLFTLWHPTDDFGPASTWNKVEGEAQQWVSYLASVEVCWRYEKVTFPFPICSNLAVIDPSRNFVFASTMHALSRFCVPSAASTALLPQQFFACQWRPLVDLASLVSKNRWTSCPFFPLHFPAVHSNTWRWRPFTYSTWSLFLKKTYMGDVQSFDKHSYWIMISSVWYTQWSSYPIQPQRSLRVLQG